MSEVRIPLTVEEKEKVRGLFDRILEKDLMFKVDIHDPFHTIDVESWRDGVWYKLELEWRY